MTTGSPQQAGGSTRLLRVLHVGVSNRGEWPLKRCDASTGFQSAALCDVSPDALARARELTGLPESACYTDYARALADAEVDCVIVCAPTKLHVPLAKAAIEAGLPVLVEKGMAPDWAGAQALASFVRERNAIAAVAQNYRYNATEHTIWRAVNDPAFEGYVGDVHLAVYTQNRVRPVPRTLTYPFASVWDMSCHHFDNLLFWFGPIEAMTAFAWGAAWSAYEHPNNTAAHIQMKSGARVHYLHTHDASRASFEIQLHGERGALFVEGDRLAFSARPTEQFGNSEAIAIPRGKGEGESDLLRDFHRYVVDGVEPGVSVRNNLETMAACEMMVRSASSGRTCRRSDLDGHPREVA